MSSQLHLSREGGLATSPDLTHFTGGLMVGSTDNHVKQIQPSGPGDTIEDGVNVFEEHSEEEEKQLVRKLDRRILPIACLLYLFACKFLSA